MRKSIPPQLSSVVAAMRDLPPTGEGSFEDLIARLLSKVSGERIRRCNAGSQGGVDAIAEIPFAVEDKRYTTQLSSRDLVGGLTQAAGTYPNLELWILVATCEVSAQTRAAVIDAGARQGIAVLILDTAADGDLPGVSGIAALAATDADTTLRVLSETNSRTGGKSSDLNAIEAELNEIRLMPGSKRWAQRLRNEVRDLPTWKRLAVSQNERLRTLILSNAANAFGTPYDPATAVPRSVETELSAWIESCLNARSCEVGVVTGQRYDGKTTLVFRWLTENLPKLQVPVFFFSSRAVQSVHGDIGALVFRDAEEALGSFARHAKNLIERRKSQKDAGVWCVIVLDGANEYADLQARSMAVLGALPPKAEDFRTLDDASGDLHADPCRHTSTNKCQSALLVTCRARDFDEDSSWLQPWPTRRLNLGPYDEREFTEALLRRNADPSEFADLPNSAAEMIRHPRYLDLVLRHRDELGQFSVITADVLHYLDASNKVPTAARLSADAFKAFLNGLAATWIRQQPLNYSTIRKQVREVTDSVDASMAALVSEGVLIRGADGFFVPDGERLALGMGLFIRESVLSLPENAQAEKLKDILEPHPDDDEKVRWLRAAVTTSVLAGDDRTHPGTVDLLLITWLSSRNFSQHDLSDVKSLSPLLIDAMLRTVSADAVDSGVLLIAQAMIETEIPRHQDLIAATVRRWFRLVPTDTFWHGDDALGEAAKEAERIALAVSDSSLADLGLRLTAPSAGASVRKRHRFGLSVACRHSIVAPSDLLALVAGRGLTHWNLNDGELFAVRLLLADAAASWFANEVRAWEARPNASRTAFLRDLIDYSQRADIVDLQSRLPALQYYEWRRPTTRAELYTVDDTEDEKELLLTAKRAAWLALDPNCPLPPRAWRLKLAKAAIVRFSDSGSLHAGRCMTSDDLEFEQLEQAIAAWAPDAGAHIMHSFLADIPRRINAGEESWSWALEQNASLLTAAERRELLHIVLTSRKTEHLSHALRRAYLCVMAAAPARERLRLLVHHPFIDIEWNEFYEILAVAADDSIRKQTIAAVRVENDPCVLKRARLFLAHLGGFKPSSGDLAHLISQLSQVNADRDSEYATRTLLRYSAIATTTPASALGSLVHVTDSLSEEAWQYEAYLHTKRNPGIYSAEWIARARSAPLTARHHGAHGADDEAVAKGIERLAARVENRLTQHAPGHGDQFPEGIAAEISEPAFNEWLERLLASREKRLPLDHGVVLPVLHRALKTRHPLAKELWALAHPFQRSGFSFGVRFTVQGLDWPLVEIHDAAIDDGLAREILRELIVDCRSNSELVSVAIGARLESLSRLTVVVEDLLDNGNETERARARFIAGWIPESTVLRQRLATADPSRWVTKIGQTALDRLDREDWARQWLHRFLNEKRRPHRWAAGRLFLACSDAATPFWAREAIIDSRAPSSRRAEAALLIGRIRKKVDDSDLRDKFLRHSVRELSDVVRPWHQSIRWEDIDVTPHED